MKYKNLLGQVIRFEHLFVPEKSYLFELVLIVPDGQSVRNVWPVSMKRHFLSPRYQRIFSARCHGTYYLFRRVPYTKTGLAQIPHYVFLQEDVVHLWFKEVCA